MWLPEAKLVDFFDATAAQVIDAAPLDGIPDFAEAAPPPPFSSNSSRSSTDAYMTLTGYDSAGRPYETIDNLGRINETVYDAAGRTVRTIQNFDGLAYGVSGGASTAGNVLEASTDKDVTVDYQYDAARRLVTMTAYDAMGTGNGVQRRPPSTSTPRRSTPPGRPPWSIPLDRCALARLGHRVWTITTDNGDHTSTTYDRLGRTISTTDQRGVVHTYSFDTAGRVSADTVTSLGSTGIVDGTVCRIGTTYDDTGRVQTVTSYSDSSYAQWASSVVDFSSQWDTGSWSAAQACGPPDVTTYGDDTHAWCPAPADGPRVHHAGLFHAGVRR